MTFNVKFDKPTCHLSLEDVQSGKLFIYKQFNNEYLAMCLGNSIITLMARGSTGWQEFTCIEDRDYGGNIQFVGYFSGTVTITQ